MKSRTLDIGDKNIVGERVAELRAKLRIKQCDFLAQFQLNNMNISATSLSRLEGQHRLVQDLEAVVLTRILGVDVRELLGMNGD